MRALEEHPLLRLLLDPAEADALLRDLPEGALEELARSDDEFFRDIVLAWERSGVVADGSAELMGGLSRALYAVVLQRSLVCHRVTPGRAMWHNGSWERDRTREKSSSRVLISPPDLYGARTLRRTTWLLLIVGVMPAVALLGLGVLRIVFGTFRRTSLISHV